MKIDIFAYPKASRLLASAGIVGLLTVVAVVQSSWASNDWGGDRGLKLCPKNSHVAVIAETKNYYINICYEGSKVKWYSAVEKANLRNRMTRPASTIEEGVKRKWVARNGDTRYEVIDSKDLRVYRGKKLILQERFVHFHIVGD